MGSKHQYLLTPKDVQDKYAYYSILHFSGGFPDRQEMAMAPQGLITPLGYSLVSN